MSKRPFEGADFYWTRQLMFLSGLVKAARHFYDVWSPDAQMGEGLIEGFRR